MKRRKFIQLAVVASVAATATPEIISAQNGKSRINLPFSLNEATIADLQAKMQSGDMSAKEIANAYIKRIGVVDRELNSVIEVNPDAAEIAESLDRERKAGKARSPLHGIPVLLKDNIDTADKMKTTAGSWALFDSPAPKQDAFLVQQLRQAGAVILGKTNLSEWANFRSSSSISGWSGRGGQTHNPYILERNPCGSSSGSGAAIAANLSAAAIGTETDGSIVCPSSNCGIVGIKPTLGLISRSGVIPIAHSQDTAGPMARTVADAATLLSFMTRADAKDSATSQNGKKAERDYTKFLDKKGLAGKRIGVVRQYWGKNPKLDKVLEEALDAMRREGATLIDVQFPTLGKFGDAESEVLNYEFKTDLNKYLVERNAKYKSLKELIDFNEANKDREMPLFGQEIFIKAETKGTLNDRAYRLALQKSKTMSQAQGIDAVMIKNKLDALLAPTNGPVWLIDSVNGDCGSGYVDSSTIAAVAGYPAITVPAGFVQELPIGVTFFAGAYSEAKLIAIAYAFEQATKARRSPKFL
jgi:amidase